MTSSQKNLSFISWQLLSELDEMKHDQYAWLMQARENLLDNWKDYRARYRSWRRKVDGLVDDLAQKGDAEGASWLTQTLLRDPIISNPAEFELTIPTGNGSEVIHVRGCPDQPAAVTAQQPPSVPGLDVVEVQLPLPPPAAALGSDAAAKVVKKKRGQPQSAIPQSAAEDAEDPVSEHEQYPTDAITESHVTTRAQSSRTKRKKTTQHAPRKKTAQQASRKKIARRASPEPKKRSPGRPSKTAITRATGPECPYSSWTLIRLREEVRARSATAPIRRPKAELIHFLIQNDKDGANDPIDASESAQDDEASTSNPTEDETSGTTDEATNTTGNGAVDSADDGREEVPESDIVVTLEGEAEEHDSESPSTNDESQAALDAVCNVLTKLAGNEEDVPKVTDA